MNNADELAKYQPSMVVIQYFTGLLLLKKCVSANSLIVSPNHKNNANGVNSSAKNAKIASGSNNISSIIL